MTAVLEAFSYGRVLGVFAALLFAAPMMAETAEKADRPADPGKRRPGDVFMRAARAFVRACFLIELLALALGWFRLSFPATIITCYLAAMAAIALFRRRKSLNFRELMHDAVLRAMVALESTGVKAMPARALTSLARAKFLPAHVALFAVLVGVTGLERTWFALHDARFTGSETYDRALALGEMVNSGARGM